MKRTRLALAQLNARGFTLVELMVSMVLGLIVVGGALSIIASNKQSYRTNEALSQVQESARSAFELLARDIRQAGATGCDNTGRVGSVLNSGSQWWQGDLGVLGYDGAAADPAVAFGSAVGERVTGTDSIQIRGVEGAGVSVETHSGSSANIKINAPTTSIIEGDILVVCDFDHATIFQVTNYNDKNVTVVHNTGVDNPLPGNASKGLGYPADTSSKTGNVYSFAPNSQIAKFGAVTWYIGNNGRPDESGKSLYRRRLASGATSATEEVVAGVTNLELKYRVEGTTNFVAAGGGVTDWSKVNAISVTYTVDSADARVSTNASVNSGRLQRAFTHIVTLRNKVP